VTFLIGLVLVIINPSHGADGFEKKQAVKPMDWSRPVVSRGFGYEKQSETDTEELVKQYKSGQVFYFFGDYKGAINKWMDLVEKQYAPAQASMAWLYQAGLGVEKDLEKAISLYDAAAKSGNAVAQNNLGVIYEQGLGGLTKNYHQARKLYQQSAENGYRFAQYNYANLLENGLGGALDKALAIRWYQKAAEQDVPSAKEKLQTMGIELTNKP